MAAFKKITVSVFVAAPIGDAWRTFVTPASIQEWNFASDDWRCPRVVNDLREGGAFNYRMESKDGKAGFDFTGTYLRIIPENLIEYALDDGRKVSVNFRSRRDGTELIETFEAEWDNAIQLQRQGWQAILDNFKKLVEGAEAR